MDKLQVAQKFFGIPNFRGDQATIIDAILNNQDVLAIQGTGFGKSLCFQVPALIRTGLTLVISPLVALMEDQVNHLMDKGIWATAIHRGLSNDEVQHRLDLLHLRQYHLLYLSPEKLASRQFTRELAGIPIAQLVVDEAHCISEWGHDFRPEYRLIGQYVASISHRVPICAFTATAPSWVKQDIIDSLLLQNAQVFEGSILRSNLTIRTYATHLESEKWERLITEIALLQREKAEYSIIVYVVTRAETEQIAEALNRLHYYTGVFASAYHAGMNTKEKQRIQTLFEHGRIRCIVATNAFGMGVDKNNVRLVVLYGAPASPESLLQQIGRAGRDGQPAQGVIVYSQRDFTLHQQLRSNSDNTPQKTVYLHRLQSVLFQLSAAKCRWQLLGEYYDESLGLCGHCDICKPDTIPTVKPGRRPDLLPFTNQQRRMVSLLQQTFPHAECSCIPGFGKGIQSYVRTEYDTARADCSVPGAHKSH